MIWSNRWKPSVIGISATATARPRRQIRAVMAAAVEALETRRLLTSLIVNTTADTAADDSTITGPTVSLREAVNYENANGGGTISFATSLTASGPAKITLTNEGLDITGSLTITGLGANQLTIDGGQSFNIFIVDDESDALQNVAISGLTMTNSSKAVDNYENLTLFGDVISNNLGSGLVNEAKATLTSSGDAFINNTTRDGGGGVYNDGTFFSSNDTFSGNTAADGGAIANLNNATLTDDTITQNTAADVPGASTGYAGGVFTFGGTLTLADTIIAGNTAFRGDPDVRGTFTSQGHNLIGDGTTGTGFVASDQVGTNTNPINAMLGTLGNNGGTTPTVPLLPGSPAIGAGAPTDYSGTTTPITTDQRGVSRHSTPDIGAYEAPRNSLVVTTLTDEDNGNADPSTGAGTSLREAINYANSLTGSQTVTFASALTSGGPATITLTGGNLDITGSVAIAGPGANELTIDGNKTAQIVVDDSTQTTQNVAITGLTITDAPGAIDNSENLTLGSDLIINNSGPGVKNESVGTLTSSGDAFAGNINSQFGGGGISNYGTLYSSNDTFSGNSGSNGGGIYSQGTGAATGDTITKNRAIESFPSTGYAGGLYVLTGTFTIGNTIIAGNTSDEGGPDVSGAFTSSGHNLIGDGTGASGFVGSDQVGTTATPINSLLGTLANYGGPIPTVPLLPGSPAIDAGSNALAVDQNGKALSTDGRGTGYPRIVNSTVDIGAFESGGFTISATSGSGQSAQTGSAFANPLKVTVTATNAGEPVTGGKIAFTAPATGASATFGTNPITLAADGTGSTNATANSSGGQYNVTATATGIITPATFSLTNIAATDSIVGTDYLVSSSTTAASLTTSTTGTPISGTSITLTGTDVLGNAVSKMTTTSTRGSYSFPGLNPSNASGYTITETVPAADSHVGQTSTSPGAVTTPATTAAVSKIVLSSDGASSTDNFFDSAAPAPVGELTGTQSANTTASYGNLGSDYTKAFDNNVSTYFNAPSANGNYLQIDFGSAKTISSFDFAPRVGFESRMVGGVFEVSNDSTFATGFLNIYTVSSAPPDGLTTIATNISTPYRYIRYVAPGNSYGNIAEFHVFGPGGTTNSSLVQITGTPSANTTASYNNSGDNYLKAFDGNTGTAFDSPNASGNYVQLDFGSATKITQIAYAPRPGFESRMVGGVFEVSNDANFASGVQKLYTVTAPPADGLTMQAVSASGTYRYIRYVAPNNSYGSIAELQVFGPASPNTTPTPTKTNVQLAGTASANTTASYGNSGNTYQKAFDGNTGTFFDAPNPSGNYIQLDLGSAATITQIGYAPRVGFESRMVGGVFEVSNDANFASGVQTVYTVNAAPADGLTMQAVNPSGNFRYVRYVAPTNSYGDIAEMQVFGPSPTTPPSTPTATKLSGSPSANTTASYASSGNTYLKAFDGDTNSFFDAPNPSGNYVQLDLGTVKSISQIAYAPRSGFGSRMLGGIFEGSNDSNFASGVTKLYTVTAQPLDGLTTVTLSSPVSFRYVRYLAPDNSYGNIAEMQLFG